MVPIIAIVSIISLFFIRDKLRFPHQQAVITYLVERRSTPVLRTVEKTESHRRLSRSGAYRRIGALFTFASLRRVLGSQHDSIDRTERAEQSTGGNERARRIAKRRWRRRRGRRRLARVAPDVRSA